MTDQTITLDLAQQIAEAMSRTDEPKQHDRGPQICEDFNVFGTVPPHLRHLHNLMLEASDKFYLDTSGHESEAKLDANLVGSEIMANMKVSHGVYSIAFTRRLMNALQKTFAGVLRDRHVLPNDWQFTYFSLKQYREVFIGFGLNKNGRFSEKTKIFEAYTEGPLFRLILKNKAVKRRLQDIFFFIVPIKWRKKRDMSR